MWLVAIVLDNAGLAESICWHYRTGSFMQRERDRSKNLAYSKHCSVMMWQKKLWEMDLVASKKKRQSWETGRYQSYSPLFLLFSALLVFTENETMSFKASHQIVVILNKCKLKHTDIAGHCIDSQFEVTRITTSAFICYINLKRCLKSEATIVVKAWLCFFV